MSKNNKIWVHKVDGKLDIASFDRNLVKKSTKSGYIHDIIHVKFVPKENKKSRTTKRKKSFLYK